MRINSRDGVGCFNTKLLVRFGILHVLDRQSAPVIDVTH